MAGNLGTGYHQVSPEPGNGSKGNEPAAAGDNPNASGCELAAQARGFRRGRGSYGKQNPECSGDGSYYRVVFLFAERDVTFERRRRFVFNRRVPGATRS